MILGLTGSVGSGKSTVADMLRQMAQAAIIDADQVARQLQQPGQACLAAIVEEFGEEMLAADGTLNRRKLADTVFQNPQRLQALNAIIHPRVWQEMENRLEQLRPTPLIVLMVPLLYEIGADALCDAVAVVTIPDEERYRRLRERDGLTQKQIQDRLAAQMPQDEKVARADYVIDNSGALPETRLQVEALVKKLNLPAA